MIGSMLHSESTTPFMILRANENVISKRKGLEEKKGLWDPNMAAQTTLNREFA